MELAVRTHFQSLRGLSGHRDQPPLLGVGAVVLPHLDRPIGLCDRTAQIQHSIGALHNCQLRLDPEAAVPVSEEIPTLVAVRRFAIVWINQHQLFLCGVIVAVQIQPVVCAIHFGDEAIGAVITLTRDFERLAVIPALQSGVVASAAVSSDSPVLIARQNDVVLLVLIKVGIVGVFHRVAAVALLREAQGLAVLARQRKPCACQELGLVFRGSLLDIQVHRGHCVQEEHRVGSPLNEGACGVALVTDHAVHHIGGGVAGGRVLCDHILTAVGQVGDDQVLAALQRELAAVPDGPGHLHIAILTVLGVGVLVVQGFAIGIVELDGEVEVLIQVAAQTFHLLLDAEAAHLLDRDLRNGGKDEAHVAGGTGSAALGVEEGEGVGTGLGRPVLVLHIIPQVHVLAHGGMHAADVADQLAVQEDPHIIVAEEEVFQGTGVILGQCKLQSELHAEEAVVVFVVVTGREHCGLVVNCKTLIPLALAKIRVLPVCGLIHGPEVVGENVVVPC